MKQAVAVWEANGTQNCPAASNPQRPSDFDKECYTRANVALSRATDLTVLACPLNMHGLEGAAQVIAALLHGACTLRTSNTMPGTAQVEGSFEIFFHECGRRVGGVPRSSLKGKETQHDEGKRTQANPKPSKTHQTKTRTKNQNATKGQRPIPPHLTVFPLYQGETCEKDC